MLSQIAQLLETAGGPASPLRRSELYNETWMLRLTLHHMANNSYDGHVFQFAKKADWFSEALLASQFLPRTRGDHLSEGWTNADGVVGHFLSPNQTPSGELRLHEYVGQFVVIESKMFSGLSSGVKNVAGYDQAARSVACMAAVLSRAQVPPSSVARLAFFVVAPKFRIDLGVFGGRVTKESIRDRVRRRTDAYGGLHDDWYNEWFVPTLDHMDVSLLAWEQVLAPLTDELKAFYGLCLE